MNKEQTISTNFKPYADPVFIDLGENIVKGMDGNAYYPTPPRPLLDLSKLLLDLDDAVKAMKTGLKAATQERDYLRPQAEEALRNLSAYATATTPGRPDLWAAANFPLTKSGTSPRPASQPVTGLSLTDGPSAHTLVAIVDRQKKVYGYQWRVYLKDTSAAELAKGFCYRACVSREPKVLLENLESGVVYGVECAAWNNTGPLQWSAPVFRIVQ